MNTWVDGKVMIAIGRQLVASGELVVKDIALHPRWKTLPDERLALIAEGWNVWRVCDHCRTTSWLRPYFAGLSFCIDKVGCVKRYKEIAE